jgi:hypothetical protein
MTPQCLKFLVPADLALQFLRCWTVGILAEVPCPVVSQELHLGHLKLRRTHSVDFVEQTSVAGGAGHCLWRLAVSVMCGLVPMDAGIW